MKKIPLDHPRALRMLGLVAVVSLAACGKAPEASGPMASPAAAPAEETVAEVPAQDAFFANLTTLCGQSFNGQVEVDEPAVPDNDAFANQALVMHVRDCSDSEIRIPFHVGEDHSRTWIVTRTDDGLRLKHDHRHEDGTPDAVTMYGGDTASEGTANRQEFPVDAESIATFEQEGLDASVTNTWAIEVVPGEHYTYELARPGGRLFRVRFDL